MDSNNESFLLKAIKMLTEKLKRLANIKEGITAIGLVNVRAVYADGTVEPIFRKNLVVDDGKTLLAHLLGGGSSDAITTMGFGTGTTAAAATDEALEASAFTADVTVSYPAYNQVMFAASMGSSEGGANTYTELGLITAGATMFSRVIIPAVVKSTLYRLEVEWTISFQ